MNRRHLKPCPESGNREIQKTIAFVESYRLQNSAQVNQPVEAESVADWKLKLEQAVEQCCDALRRGETLNGTQLGFNVRMATVLNRAKARLRREDEAFAFLGPVLGANRSSVSQYLLFLCLLLGLVSGKPAMGIREISTWSALTKNNQPNEGHQ